MTAPLQTAAAEIESYVARLGWDAPPTLFALVTTQQLAADDPDVVARLGLRDSSAAALTPVEQEGLPSGDLDEVLAQITWPAEVVGCAVSQHIVMLPPSAEAEIAHDEATTAVATALAHPERREARLVAAVLRDGSSCVLLRLRAIDSEPDDLLTGPDLAPNLVRALLATFD